VPTGDPLHRCSLAHYMADLYEDPAQALAWDIRALDAVDALTDQRVQEHHAALQVAGFYPSLHLNLADNYRRLGSFEAATEHISAAQEHAPNLPQDAYGALLWEPGHRHRRSVHHGLSIGLEPIPTMPDGPSDTHTQQRDSAN
jgi:hypothetical protein